MKAQPFEAASVDVPNAAALLQRRRIPLYLAHGPVAVHVMWEWMRDRGVIPQISRLTPLPETSV